MLSAMAILAAASMTLSTLTGAASWIGGHPSASDLRGKVVLVDVFTFDCINCKHVVPELRRLNQTISRKDFRIVGIHAPETPYERNVRTAARNFALQGITWPVAVDNDYALWNAYGLEYWPTQLIFDRQGKLRKTVIGEGQDALVQSTVLQLIREDPK
jgi:thiol-disulfide isomerase/thioredoxin